MELDRVAGTIHSSPTVAAEVPGATRDEGARAAPAPRRRELATDMDDTRLNGYWAQAANAVPVQMAVLSLRFDQGWYPRANLVITAS